MATPKKTTKAKTKAKAAPKAKKVAATKTKTVAKSKVKTKAQIIAALAEAAEISKPQAKVAYETLLDIAYTGAKSKDGFMIPGLGKLIKVHRKARAGRNPATGETIKIPAKTVVKFRLSKVCKDTVLPPKK